MSTLPRTGSTGPPWGRVIDPAAVAAACEDLRRVPAEDLLGELCRRARALLDGDRAGVAVAEGHELVLVASQGRVPDQRGVRDAGARLPMAGSVAGVVLASGQPHVVHDTRTHPQGGFTLNDVEHVRSSVVVPLHRRATGGGAVLTVMSSRPGAMDQRGREVVETLVAAAREGEDRLGQAVDEAAARVRTDGEQLYRTVLESLGEGVVVHGHLGQVLVHNEAAARLLGLTADELVSRSVSDPRWCMLETDGRRVAAEDHPAARALRTGVGERDRLLLLRRPDGAERVMSVTTLPRLDLEGCAYSAVVSFADVTDAHRLAERAQEQARHLHAAMQLAQLATWETTLGTDDWSFSELLHQVTGQPPGTEVSDAAVREWFGPAYPRLLSEWSQVLAEGRPRQVTVEIGVPGGGTRTVSVWLDLTCDEDGVPVRQWGVVQDVTERVAALRHLQESEEVFRLTFDRAPIGMTMLAADGSGRVLRSNAAFRRMIGRADGTDETDPLTIATWTRPEDLARDRARSLAFVTGDRGQDAMEKTYVRADGTTFDALLSASVARDADGRPVHVLCHVMDVSERAAHARELERLALTDGLTGLPNRRRMEDRLARALSDQDVDGGVGLVLLDLDHFKVVNDSLGHGAGDALLVHVAARLQCAVPAGTTVARLGGDEFVAVVVGEAALRVPEVAAAMLASLARPFDLDGTAVVATASLGLAVGDRSGTPWELLRQADLALYRAKETGRDRVVAFDAALRTRADERLATEAVLRGALEHGWLRLHLQPVVGLTDGHVVGAEALVRLEHPERGLLLPGAFMDVAEETGLVTAVDAWVLDEVLAGLAARPGTRVAVNVSARTLEAGGLAERVRAALARHGVDPGRLSVELTETSLLARAATVAEDVRGLRALGCRVGLDDFGTGYSALSHLQAFELDFLKIDRSFISELGRGEQHDAVVKAVVDLAHAHRLVVVAEGVEDDEQRRLLRAMGCDEAQGWLFGRPAAP